MASYGYETPDGKKVSAFIDAINGGGAGRSGDTFEGGGILSVLANMLASPYGSKRDRGTGQGEQLRLPGGPAPENALTLDQFAMQNVRPQARPTGPSAADLMAGDQAAYDAAFGKAPGLTDGEVLQQGLDQVVADPALMSLLGITEGPRGMPSPIAPDMGPEIFVPGSDASLPRPPMEGRHLEMSKGDTFLPKGEGRGTRIGDTTYLLMPDGTVYNAETNSVVTDFDTQAAVMRKLMADMGQ